MNSPCHDTPMVEVEGSNLEMCTQCLQWYLIDEESGVMTEVI